jgi:pimeloyl-ACP methyl ester carboxylesterase
MDSRFVKVNGILTHYLEGGSTTAPTLVLIHDGAYGAEPRTTWGPLLEQLAGRYHVYAPDLLGFGQTQKVYDFDKDARMARVEHVAQFLDTLNIPEASFMGNSMGGTAVLLAAAFRKWPIRNAISVAGTGGPHMLAERYASMQDYEPSEQAMRGIVELFMHRRDELFEQTVRARDESSMIPGHWESMSAPRLRNPAAPRSDRQWLEDYLAALQTLETPVLLIAGADDWLLESGWQNAMMARMPNARAHVVDHAKHQPHMDNPDEVFKVVARFLDE